MAKKNFDTWYAHVCDELKKKGYTKAPDTDDARELYDAGRTAEQAAQEYADDWGDEEIGSGELEPDPY